jgi:hypothetical protein
MIMNCTRKTYISAILIVVTWQMMAQETELLYLSGKGSDSPVGWQFFCTGGANSGKWTSIPVPSNWELQGFGTYNYGLDKDTLRGKEKGLFRYSFQVPSEWKRKQVDIVFEGSMTDTEVKINGKIAGPVHQGAFYQFRYDIGNLLKYGGKNLLEVSVSKQSANESVNKAERHGDFWIFGGIFRPVYLEAKPLSGIVHASVDARADGSLKADVILQNIISPGVVTAQVYTLTGEKTGSPLQSEVKPGDYTIHLSGNVPGIRSWNPEFPNLYKVVFCLVSGGITLHQTEIRTGFRTVEIRRRDGIYINGVKIKFRGVCHHTFWPATGRASCKQRSVEDVLLMKEMNMNAVRTSHYPPDSHFLDACDSLGLFVVDELTGWHNAYDTKAGSILTREMVNHDVNHPSVVIWSNGNEGGHNPELDPLFERYDIQKRPVIHPWQTFNGFDNQHYINYDYGSATYWHGHEIVFPTEFLHGLYDGGLGAGLYDFWELMWLNPRSAGGFLWVFADEGVVRTDKNNEIDTDGNHAPDGILGPCHEKEGSFYAIKEIWAPIRFEPKDITDSFDGRFYVENRFHFTRLDQCDFRWKLVQMPSPDGKINRNEVSGLIIPPPVSPGNKGELKLELPGNWMHYDVLYLTAFDPLRKEIFTWSWPITLPASMSGRLLIKSGRKAEVSTENDSTITISGGNTKIKLGKHTGLLESVETGKGEIPFNHGPVLCAGLTGCKSMTLKQESDTVKAVFTFTDVSKMKELTWVVYPSGCIRLDISYNPVDYESDFMGVSFSFPEKEIKAVRWMGRGPYRVWKNRPEGGTLDVHEKTYNNTITGISPLNYPEFKGYHSQMYWVKFITRGQPFLVATGTEDIFLRLFTPPAPEPAFNTAPPFPPGDISFLQGIPAIGTKSQKPENLGPSGKKNLYFDYGPYDKWQERCLKMTLFFDFSIENETN